MAANSSNTVSVGCKLPMGVTLDLYNLKATPQGGAPVPVQSFTLKGSRFPKDDNGVAKRTWEVVGGEEGFGITSDVPREFWDAWLEAHKTSDLVTSGIIFALPDAKDVASEAENRQDIKSAAPMNPDKPAPGIEKSDDVK